MTAAANSTSVVGGGRRRGRARAVQGRLLHLADPCHSGHKHTFRLHNGCNNRSQCPIEDPHAFLDNHHCANCWQCCGTCQRADICCQESHGNQFGSGCGCVKSSVSNLHSWSLACCCCLVKRQNLSMLLPSMCISPGSISHTLPTPCFQPSERGLF